MNSLKEIVNFEDIPMKIFVMRLEITSIKYDLDQ